MEMRSDTLVLKQKASTAEATPVLATNKLIRNTYILLSLTLAFTAIMSAVAMATKMAPMHWLLVLGGYFGLLFLTTYLRNSVWGLASVFALTGFMGLTLGPIISLYLTMFSNGAQLVTMAFGTTAVVFLGLSGYALTSRKDFSFMGGFLMTGILVAFVASLIAVIFSIPALSLAVSAVFVMLMAGLILYQTSEMVHGGETNYIMATIGLYVSIYNMFLSLLQLFGFFGGED
jgi:modulator of FtsH protease